MDQLAESKRGEEAERLMANPIMQEAFSKVREGIVNSMKDSAFGDEKTHHHLVIALQVLGQIEKHMHDVAVTGKMARIQIERGLTGKLRAAAGF